MKSALLTCLIAFAPAACAGSKLIKIELLHRVDVAEMRPISLPEQPLKAPPGSRLTMLTMDGKRIELVPGTVYRRDSAVIAQRLGAEVSFELGQVQALVFENVTRLELSRTTTPINDGEDVGATAGWVIGTILVVGILVGVVVGVENFGH